jgi:hydroxymethylpyrimidine/phosphomethylpyrimidine kinase
MQDSNLISKNILSIAGSDPISKSGIMADFRVGMELSANIFNVITAINAQNNSKIKNICYLEPKIIADQLEVIFLENKIDIVKIGMVGNFGTIEIISDFFQDKNIPIIFDPVITASNGYDLLPKNSIPKIQEKLFFLSYLITPNINELEILSESKINNFNDIKNAVKILQNFGVENILVKGGHFQENSDFVTSFLFENDKITEFKNARLNKNLRGTGCMLATAIAIFLARDYDLVESIEKGNRFIYNKIKES